MTRRSGFTLVELVVVILILGILAGVAAPKMFSTSQTATENGLRQTLSIVRDAIELYAARNGGVPPADASALVTQMAQYLRGGIPKCPVGATTPSNTVADGTTPGALDGWLYDGPTGTFICAYDGDDSNGDDYSSY